MDGTEYITLKEASELSGYSPDYIGQLIRRGKLTGKQVYANVAWVTTRDALSGYLEEKGKTKKIAEEHEGSKADLRATTGARHFEEGFSPIPRIASPLPSHVPEASAQSVFEADVLLWERIFRAFSLGTIFLAGLFLVFLFYILSNVLDEKLERSALKQATATLSSPHL
jgi:hypothetical protein